MGRCTRAGQASRNIVGSLVTGGHIGYIFKNGILYALTVASGQVVTSIDVGQANRFATPTLSGTNIFIGTLGGLAVTIV